MAPGRRFTLRFAHEAVEHLDSIERKYHGLIRANIRQRLTVEPLRETRNRKPLNTPAPFAAAWELRFGPGNRFRVFYEVDEINNEVRVLAIGVKSANRLLIGGEEYHT